MTTTMLLFAAGLVITWLLHRRAVQINRRHQILSGSERDVAAPWALRPGQAPSRTVPRG